MVRVYRRTKTVLITLFTGFLILSIYQILLSIHQEQKRSALFDLFAGKPLCAGSVGVIKRLRRLTQDLIYIRMTVNHDPAIVQRIEDHYNNLQKLLREIEFMTNAKNHTEESTENRRTLTTGQELDLICPEVFRGSTFGYPFYRKGFETTNCTTKSRTPMTDFVTLIFDDVPVAMKTVEGEIVARSDNNYLESLSKFIENIYEAYPGIQAFVLLNKSTKIVNILEKRHKKYGIEFIQLNGSSRGRVLRNVIAHVRTPYVLVAPDLTHFTRDIKLERLIRVISSRNSTHFVGGSSRNLSGHWSIDCQQTQLRNYTLTHKTGYRHSLGECLVCEYLSGPFIARTSTLKDLRIDVHLNHGVYRDLFLRIKSHFSHSQDGELLSCPDVMFNAHARDVKDSDLQHFAKKHSIRKVVETDGRVRWYGCRNGLAYRSGDRCPLRRGLLVPPCCLENLADAIKVIMSLCDSFNIVCELQEGTLLGAIKLNKVLPWERDADITFLTKHYERLTGIKREYENRGYIFRDISAPWCCVEGREAGGKIEILADGWSIQMYGQHTMDSETLINKGLRPTKVLFSGQWVNVPSNPGEHIRNRYGREIYRHAEHWMSTGADSGWDKYNTAGGFGPCPLKGFHGCIDQYVPDGSLQFENLF